MQENTFISEFDVKSNGAINVRKTTEILKDGKVIATTYWRGVLTPDTPNVAEILNEPFYFNLANTVWNS